MELEEAPTGRHSDQEKPRPDGVMVEVVMVCERGYKCLMCGESSHSGALCSACAPRVRAALEDFKIQAQEVAGDPKRNPFGFTVEAVLGAMMRQSGWSNYFPYVLEGST